MDNLFTSPVRTVQDLEERVEYWHTHETGNTLREFLGISKEEYQLWLTKGDDALIAEILSSVRQRKRDAAGGALQGEGGYEYGRRI